MSTRDEQWNDVYTAFNPRRPAEGDLRAERPYSRANEILDAVQNVRSKKVLFKGTAGNGKTTELLHVVAQMQGRRFAVFFDVEHHFRATMRDDAALQQTQPWELLFLAGVALWRGGREAGIPWPPAQVAELEAAYAALLKSDDGEEVRVDIAAIAGGLALTVAGASISGAPSAAIAAAVPALQKLSAAATWVVPFRFGGRSPLPDQDPRVARLVQAVDALVLQTAQAHMPVLLVLDGLDRLGPEAARRHFASSGLLTELSCSVVLTGPPHLVATRTVFDRVVTLENVPVLDVRQPMVPADRGCAFFRELWRRRAAALPTAMTDAQLDRLAWASGGLPRMFCKMIQGVIDRATERQAERVEDAWIEAEVDQRRREIEDGMRKEEFQLLAAVAADPAHELPRDELAEKLVDEQRLLPYPNESVWYFPHPLLTLKKVPVRPSGSSAGS